MSAQQIDPDSLANSTATNPTTIVTTGDASKPWGASHLASKIELMRMQLRKDTNHKLQELRNIEQILDELYNSFFPEKSPFDFSILRPRKERNKLTPIEEKLVVQESSVADNQITPDAIDTTSNNTTSTDSIEQVKRKFNKLQNELQNSRNTVLEYLERIEIYSGIVRDEVLKLQRPKREPDEPTRTLPRTIAEVCKEIVMHVKSTHEKVDEMMIALNLQSPDEESSKPSQEGGDRSNDDLGTNEDLPTIKTSTEEAPEKSIKCQM